MSGLINFIGVVMILNSQRTLDRVPDMTMILLLGLPYSSADH